METILIASRILVVAGFGVYWWLSVGDGPRRRLSGWGLIMAGVAVVVLALFQRLPEAGQGTDVLRAANGMLPDLLAGAGVGLALGMGLVGLGVVRLMVDPPASRGDGEAVAPKVAGQGGAADGATAPRRNNVTSLEEHLRMERDQLAAILAATNDGVYVVNGDYEIEYLNPVLRSRFGPVAGRTCCRYFYGRKDPCPWCPNRQVFAGETVRWEHVDSETGDTLDLVATPVRNPDGSISALTVLRDVTIHRRTVEALQRDAALSSAILDTCGALIMVLDSEGHIVRFNRACETTLGYTSAEVLGHPLWDLAPTADERAAARRVFEQLGTGRDTRPRETVWAAKEGQRRWVSVTYALLTDGQDGTTHVVVTGMDLTARREAEAQLALTLSTAGRQQGEIAELLGGLGDAGGGSPEEPSRAP